mgnify:CR=1 FL=1
MSEHHQIETRPAFCLVRSASCRRGPARFVSWLRKPSSRYARIPLAMLLIVGGIFSFLPVLGLWMLPLGLLCSRRTCRFCRSRWRGCSDGLSANGSNGSAPRSMH